MNRVLNLAAYRARLIPVNPLPRGFVPKGKSVKAKTYGLPDEDARLMAFMDLLLVERILFGVPAREGMRVSEALSLTWGDVDLEHVVLHLDENKTDDPRAWSLDLGVAVALRRWKNNFSRCHFQNARVFLMPDGGEIDRYGLATRLREGLKGSGVTRPQLFEQSDKRMPLRAHDLRATFVTINLALGRTEAWVTDRTGHRSSAMIYEYKRQARTYAELDLGPLQPLYLAIPELRESTEEVRVPAS